MAMLRRVNLLAGVTAGLVLGASAMADTQTWTYTTDDSGVWSNSANWNSGVGPAPATDGSDDVVFAPNNSGSTRLSTVDAGWAANGTVGHITFQNGSNRYTLDTGSGVTLNITGGVTNENAGGAKINGALNFDGSQTIELGTAGNIFTDSGNWTSTVGTILTVSGSSYKQVQFYNGTTDAGFQGSFRQQGSVTINFYNSHQYGRLGANTFYVDSLRDASYGSPLLGFAGNSGTFANDIVFENFDDNLSGHFRIYNNATGSPKTVTFSGDWSGEISAGNDYIGYGGIRMYGGAQTTDTNTRFLMTGDNSGLISNFSNLNTGRYPFHVFRGMLVVDSDNALGANNTLLVGVGSLNLTNSNYTGLLAADGRTIRSDIRVNANVNGFSQTVLIGADGISSTATFESDIYLDSSDNVGDVPDFRLTADTGSLASFNGVIQDFGTVLANPTQVTITGGGTVALNGANTYTGGTTVDAGTTLQGTGSLTSDVLINGSLAPGNSIGTLTVASAIFGAGSSFDVEIAAALSDLLAVNGDLDITNATLNLSGTFDDVTTYTIATYAGSLTGTFTGVTGLPGNYSIDYGTGSNSQITLTVVPEPASAMLMGLGSLMIFRRRRG